MTDYRQSYERELLESPTDVMRQYLEHFEKDTHKFLDKINSASKVWEQYAAETTKLGETRLDLTWSAAYFCGAINSAFISTRLFLLGCMIPSGNQARHALESVAFGILLAFPDTGIFHEWNKGHHIEYKAVEKLAKHAKHCGVISRESIESLKKQVKWFNQYSHPSRLSLASIWKPGESGFNVGALYVEDNLPQYSSMMKNHIDMAMLLNNAIAGTHATLIEKGVLSRPVNVLDAKRSGA